MKDACGGIILAGGLNRRMGGENKAFLSVGGEMILDGLYRTFRELFTDVVLVTNSPQDYLVWDLAIVSDLFSVRSALTGIHAGLFHIPTPHAFVAACDMPYLRKELVETLVSQVDPRWDVVIPVTEAGYQPLCAVYSKHCIHPIERQLKQGNAKIADFFSQVRVREVPEDRLRTADRKLVSFVNINTPEDLAHLGFAQK